MAIAADNILEIHNVGVSFGGIRALNEVKFGVKDKSITAIIGPNGAGKTTLFNCITGFYRTTDGDITFGYDGKSYDLGTILGESITFGDIFRPARLGRKLFYNAMGGSHKVASIGIARTFQNIRLFKDMSVIENLLVAQHNSLNQNILSGVFNTPSFRKSEQKALEKAYYWLKHVDLHDDVNRLAGELPYGHQRRLEIARAMCTDSKLICLDEPAAGLNHQETDDLSKMITSLRDDYDMTVLVIEHDMALVMDISDHIVVLDHGEVISQGAPDFVKNDPHVIKAYLGEEDDD